MVLELLPSHLVRVELDGRHIVTAHLASPAFWVQSVRYWLTESRLKRLAPFFVLGNVPLVAAFSAFDRLTAPIAGTSNQRLVARRLSERLSVLSS